MAEIKLRQHQASFWLCHVEDEVESWKLCGKINKTLHSIDGCRDWTYITKCSDS